MIEDAPVIICGFPSPAEDYREDFLDFNSYLGCNRPSVYALRARGYSMTGAGIYPDDIRSYFTGIRQNQEMLGYSQKQD